MCESVCSSSNFLLLKVTLCDADQKNTFGTKEIIITVVCALVFVILTAALIFFICKKCKNRYDYDSI